MKNLVMLIAAMGLTAPLANAETAATGAPESAPASFSQIDSDQDGVISKQEAQPFAAVEIIFDDADANKDGTLDPQEFSQTNPGQSAE